MTDQPKAGESQDPGGSERDGPTDAEAATELDRLRTRISQVDDDLIRLIGERKDLAVAIGKLKARLDRPVMDPAREAQVVRKAAERARALGVDEEMTRDVIWRIIAAARAHQEERPLGWPEQRREE